MGLREMLLSSEIEVYNVYMHIIHLNLVWHSFPYLLLHYIAKIIVYI